MSKVKSLPQTEDVASQELSQQSFQPPPQERLVEQDKAALEQLKLNRKTAILEAEKAILNSQNHDLAYTNAVLRLYMKYGLTEQDTIDESGLIVRGGAVAKQ